MEVCFIVGFQKMSELSKPVDERGIKDLAVEHELDKTWTLLPADFSIKDG
jgi:hypothetical protein